MLKNRKKKGFTLIELIVVIAILGILAAVLIPRFTGFQDKARQTQALTDAKQVATAIDSFQAEHNKWPVKGTDDAEINKLSGVAIGSETTDGFVLGSNGGFTVRATVGDTVYKAGRTSAATATGTPGKVTVTD